jgi:hypothetical protein
LLRRELNCSRDEILWEMSLPELNKMLHAYYFFEGRDTRKVGFRKEIESKFKRLKELFGHGRK